MTDKERTRRHGSPPASGPSWRIRVAARTGAVLFLAATILYSLIGSGMLDDEGSPFHKLPGRLASLAGLAADDIEITGLVHQEPETVLAAIGVTPGGSLVSFDAGKAKRILENLDWVAAAKVQRLYPNQLEVTLVERQPFAIWQRGENYYVIDREGVAMSNIPASKLTGLPLVSGEGAQLAAVDLINQLEATPDIMLQMRAALRVSDRRWTIYLDNGVTILLPEENAGAALALVERLDRTQQLLSKGITSVDLRIAGRVVVAVAEVVEQKTGTASLKTGQ